MTAQAKPSTELQTASGATDARSTSPTRPEQARELLRRNAYWALGIGLVPLPIVDFLALTTVQVKMLKEVSNLYGVEFFDDKAKKIVGSLVTGLGSVGLIGALSASFAKFVPLLGHVIGVVGMPVVGAALTLAIGNLFVMHYESGGTLLDFDPDKMREHFRQEFDRAKGTARRLQREDQELAGETPAP